MTLQFLIKKRIGGWWWWGDTNLSYLIIWSYTACEKNNCRQVKIITPVTHLPSNTRLKINDWFLKTNPPRPSFSAFQNSILVFLECIPIFAPVVQCIYSPYVATMAWFLRNLISVSHMTTDMFCLSQS